MKLITLSKQFYNDYKNYDEILKKPNRPYVCLAIEIDNNVYAIPFRHHIKHSYAFFTFGEAGLDFTKAIILIDDKYISNTTPIIEQREYSFIRKSFRDIEKEFAKFIRLYKKALKNRSIPRYRHLIEFSALKYFEDYITTNQP